MSGNANQKESFSLIVIDALLKDVRWKLTYSQSVRYGNDRFLK